MEEPLEKYKYEDRLELNEMDSKPEKKFKKIDCPSCNKLIESQDLNLQNKVAKCGDCNVVFSIEEELASVSSKTDKRQTYFRPEGIELFQYQGELDITINQVMTGWDYAGALALPFIAFFSAMIYFVSTKVSMPAVVPIISTIASVYFLYKATIYSRYKSYIIVNDEYLEIRHRPNNLKKDIKIPSKDIDQLYIRKSRERGDLVVLHIIANGPDGQKHQKLMSIKSVSKAKYIEQEIEKYLDIKDRGVVEAEV